MKQVLLALIITAFAHTATEAQMICTPAPKHKTAVKHKTVRQTTTTTTTTACRMLPFQVCRIMPDRMHVSCYATTDPDHQIQSGPATVYGPTGAMPGEVVRFKVRTVVIKGEDKGAFCRRNKEGNATICTQPGILVRSEEGYYSYAEPQPKSETRVVTAK